jgi:Ni,Fe-hydrogenase maturation factor
MKKIIVYVFGNPLVKKDSLPIELMGDLKKSFPNINFKEIDPTENLHKLGKKLYIIDTVVGIKNVTVIKDIDSIELNKIYSLHDFDLGFNLKLMKKAGIIDDVIIFGIPANMRKQEALKQLKNALKKVLNE